MREVFNLSQLQIFFLDEQFLNGQFMDDEVSKKNRISIGEFDYKASNLSSTSCKARRNGFIIEGALLSLIVMLLWEWGIRKQPRCVIRGWPFLVLLRLFSFSSWSFGNSLYLRSSYEALNSKTVATPRILIHGVKKNFKFESHSTNV